MGPVLYILCLQTYRHLFIDVFWTRLGQFVTVVDKQESHVCVCHRQCVGVTSEQFS